MEDQPAQAALAGNLRHPDYMQIVWGTLDQLPRGFAHLERRTFSGPPRLRRKNRDADLRQRNRAWAKEARQHALQTAENSPQISQAGHRSN